MCTSGNLPSVNHLYPMATLIKLYTGHFVLLHGIMVRIIIFSSSREIIKCSATKLVSVQSEDHEIVRVRIPTKLL